MEEIGSPQMKRKQSDMDDRGKRGKRKMGVDWQVELGWK